MHENKIYTFGLYCYKTGISLYGQTKVVQYFEFSDNGVSQSWTF